MIHQVQLRDVTEDDLPIFFEHQKEPEATQMAAFPARDRETFMAHWNRILGNENILKKTILADGYVAGNIVSFEQCGEQEIGYWIGKQHWGQGIATQAVAQFLNSIHTQPLYAHVAQHNIASIRVLQKCGFTIIGEDKWDSNGEEVKEFILKRNPNKKDLEIEEQTPKEIVV